MNPHVLCRTCHRTRDCMKHLRAEFPPAAARKWLKAHCGTPERCDLRYQVGLEPRLSLSPQQDHAEA